MNPQIQQLFNYLVEVTARRLEPGDKWLAAFTVVFEHVANENGFDEPTMEEQVELKKMIIDQIMTSAEERRKVLFAQAA